MTDNGFTTVANHDTNGRFTAGNRAATVRKAKAAPGSTGVISYGGIVSTGERDQALTGSQKWTTYANAYSRPPVAVAALLRYALMSGVKWSLVENEAGGRDARRGLEVCQQGLLDTRLASGDTWAEVAAKAGMYWFNGSSLHAWSLARRKDGAVVFADIAHRPMHTVDRWRREREDDETTPFVAAIQRTASGRTFDLPLSQCLYLVDRMLGDDPFGVGVLRLVVERIRRTGKYEQLEGSELFSSLGGLPIYRAPLEEIRRDVSGLPESEQQAEIDRRVAGLETVVRDRIKTPEKQAFIGLDSATYTGTDPNAITSVPKWNIEIVKGELQGLLEIRGVIKDLDLDVARILGVEFVFVGGGDSAGTYGMHESKVGVFAKSLQAGVDRIATRATQQLCRALVAANGLDPDTACPTLVGERISIGAVLETAQTLALINQAGLHPKDPARNILRERDGLPPEPEEAIEADLMAPRRPMPDPYDDDEDGDPETDPVKPPDEELTEEAKP